MYVNLNDDALLKKICKLAYPSYKGRKFEVQYNTKKITMHSYWDGGSKTDYVIVNVAKMQVVVVPDNHPVFGNYPDMTNVPIPDDFVVVAHTIFCGRDMGLTIYTPHRAPLLTDGSQLSDIEAHVLIMTAARKSSYGGIKDYRAYELRRKWGYTQAEIEATRAKLIVNGYMTKRKAITNKGRNAVAKHPNRNA